MLGDVQIQDYDPELSAQIRTLSKRSMVDAYEGASEYERASEYHPGNDMDALEEMFQDESSKVLVGTIDDQPVAVGGFLHNDDETAEIQTIRVDPDHQRNGYAQRLLELLEEEIQNRGYQRIVLHTSEYWTAAQGLYEKHGYEETHRSMYEGEEFIYYEKNFGNSTV